jgi:S-adenosylmethionine decarboxylase
MNEVQRYRVIVEAEGCEEHINRLEWVYDFFEKLSRAIDMRVLVPPVVIRVPVAQAVESIHTDSDYGISGAVIWLESGAQIHTWPEHGFFALDVFSCKAFDPVDVYKLVSFETGARHITAYKPRISYSESIGWKRTA